MTPTPEETIDAHLTYLVAGGHPDRTVDAAGWLLRKAHRELPTGLIEALPAELAAWLANPCWCAQTRATYRGHLRRFYAWATFDDDPWMTYDPSTGLRRPRIAPRLPRPAGDEQVHVAITQARQPWRLHCLLATYESLRCIEIARLRREHITEASVYVYGKGGRYRVVPTHALVWQAVHDLPAGPVTRKLDGRPADAQWVSHGTRAELHRLGLPISMHWLRHWYGTTVQRAYRDQRVTQQLMGHASPASTAGYTLVADASMRQAVDLLPDLTGRPDLDEGGCAA